MVKWLSFHKKKQDFKPCKSSIYKAPDEWESSSTAVLNGQSAIISVMDLVSEKQDLTLGPDSGESLRREAEKCPCCLWRSSASFVASKPHVFGVQSLSIYARK